MAGGKSRRIIIRPRADRDVTELARYIAEDNAEAALRFYEAAEESFNQLTRMPHLGPAREYRNPRLRGLRTWPVTGFRNYLIFY
ncbi:MAG TPA: type II toxin-antitoxin system RelE/ParE family toxin [Candidatus Binatia bacterium]|nr:type II toxin-antitoxin system RelE/ParE family toxin [Candidatus Binatia bacterium]